MTTFPQLRFRVRTMFGRAQLEQQLDDELRFHFDMQVAMNLQTGMPPLVAQSMARRQFGSLSQHKDDYRDRWGARWLEALAQDGRSGVRRLVANSASSVAIVIALALGIGVSTAVFSVFHAVLLEPLPYGQSDRLVRIQAGAHDGERLFSAPEIRDLRVQAGSLASLAEFHFMYFILLDHQEPRRVSAGVVSSNFFDVIGVNPALGRVFLPDEDKPGTAGVIVVSHKYWVDALQSDPQVIGRVFQLNDRAHTVVGVLPPLPDFPEDADIYLPTSACPLRSSEAGDTSRAMHLVSALGRVSPGADLSQMRADLSKAGDRISAEHQADYSDTTALRLSAVGVNEDLTWRFRPTLAVLLASAAFLLLSLCSSVGALLLAGVLQRRRAVAMQVALGAWRGRIFRQLATESLLLTTVGTGLGLGLAYQSLPWLTSLAARYTPRAADIHLDSTAVMFALGVSVGIGLLCGFFQMIASTPTTTRPDAIVLVQRDSLARQPVFRALIVLQIAVSFALLVGAGLTLRSVTNLERVETGYRTQDVLTLRVSIDFTRYTSDDERADLYERMIAAVQGISGVVGVGASSALPLATPAEIGSESGSITTRQSAGIFTSPASVQAVSSDYFRSVGMQLIEGRFFLAEDADVAAAGAIVNQRLAARHWPGTSAIGRQLQIGAGEWMTVVGVVADARQRLEQQPMEEVLLPLRLHPPVQGRLFVRSSRDPHTLESEIRAALRRVEPRQPIDSVQTLEGVREESVAPARLTATLIALFAVIGVAISTVGVAGVVSASVNARTREFGLQMALGAPRGRLLRSVLADGLALALGGLAIGAVLALILSRALSSILFEVPPHDVATFLAVAALLLAVTIAACFLPARRAALVDPSVALRG
jgi:putative ABC transport system permease protein